MKNLSNRTVLTLMIVIFIGAILMTICGDGAGGATDGQRMDDYEQVQLMEKCMNDATLTIQISSARIAGSGAEMQAAIALAYFQYRSGMVRPVGETE